MITYDTRPPLVVSFRDHQVVTLLVVVSATKPVLASWRDSCHAIKWSMPLNSVANILNWCSSKSFVVGAHGCSYWTALKRSIPCQQSGIIWTFVMISSCWANVQPVDRVCTWEMLLSKMWRTIGKLFFVLYEL
jgi:hypothetical protein